jgi:hypothetical protein
MSTQRDLFIPALKEAEGRGTYRREVLELMLERAMDYASERRVRLGDAFSALEAAHGGFARFHLAAQRWHALKGATLIDQRAEEIDVNLERLASMEMEPVPYRLANASSEARDLLLELAKGADQLREIRDTLSSYPDMARQVDDVISKTENSRYFETAANLLAAQDVQRTRARG